MKKEAQTLVANLHKVLADTYSLAIKTQNHHWNVTGPNFESLHLLFDQQYKDLNDAVDLIAERIRALGAKVPASFKIFAENSSIADGSENSSAGEMIASLAKDQLIIVMTLNAALSSAQELSDEVSINLIVDRLSVHEKNHWMLSASL